MRALVHQIPLTGKVLIEASAGTGKTWTLTGIILRLLLEENAQSPRLSREIIATTFTRKAAAEMRRRVHDRLFSLHHLLIALVKAYADNNAFLQDDAGLLTRAQTSVAHWQTDTTEANLRQAANDTILTELLYDSICQQGLNGVIRLIERTEARLADINEMFIGTLDSLSQRWLAEFSPETGGTSLGTLVTDKTEMKILVQNRLRQFLNEISDDEKVRLYTELVNYPQDTDTITKIASNILDLGDFNEVIDSNVAEQYRQLQAQMRCEHWQVYCANWAQAQREGWLKKTEAAHIYKIENFETCWLIVANDAVADLQKKRQIEQWSQASVNEEFWKTGTIERAYELINHPLSDLLYKAVHARMQYHAMLLSMVTIEVVYALQKNLPDVLEMQGKTTFTHQLVRLHKMLNKAGGERLAQHIAYRYPVMLVDESQDLNRRQAEILERIYLSPKFGASCGNKHQFFLLVGDPKQAIYQFRGGDVANYLRLSGYFSDEEKYTLRENYRSSDAMVSTLNYLYQPHAKHDSTLLGAGIHYEDMQASKQTECSIVRSDGTPITQPLCWITGKAGEEIKQIVQLVRLLLSEQSPYARRSNTGQIQPLHARDIMVLLQNNQLLRQLANELQTVCEVKNSAENRLFEGVIAQAFEILLLAILQPNNNAILRRLLASPLFGYPFCELVAQSEAEDADEIEQRIDGLSVRLAQLKHAWTSRAFINSLQQFLAEPLDGITVWQRLARHPKPEATRYLLDLRQIVRIVAEQSSFYLPLEFLRWWQANLAQPPSDDWAIAETLEIADAVRLMTIHKAKGLQAPVVIIAGLGARKDKGDIVQYYHDDEGTICVTTANGDTRIKQEQRAEQSRIVYVGLTRAESLLFVFRREKRSQSEAIEMLYSESHINQLDSGQCSVTLNNFASSDALLVSSDSLLTSEKKDIAYSQTRFSGWHKTSFSALAHGIESTNVEIDVELADFAVADNASTEVIEAVTVFGDSSALPATFPSGTQSGIFLHSVLEILPPNQPALWRSLINSQLQRYQLADMPLSDEEYSAYHTWFFDILNTPLVSATTLTAIPQMARVNEMSFSLLVDDTRTLDIGAINALLARWKKPLKLPKSPYFYRYLRGEIDVCYRVGDTFHVLDYKSNYLGISADCYTSELMRKAMDKHGYWLQALIYQTALHRFLKTNLPSYDAEVQLGKPEYFFIRGAQKNKPENGHYEIDLPLDIVIEFDALLQAH